MKNPLIQKFGKEKRWVNYKLEESEGRKTKVPYSPITNRLASSSKESDWGTYDQAKLVSPDVGIIFTPDQKLLGIDLDKCLINGKIQDEKIAELLVEAESYTEISPSGMGLHIFLIVETSFSLSANRHQSFECYTRGRYFTFTGNSFHKKPNQIRTVSVSEAERILAVIGYPWGKTEESKPEGATTSHIEHLGDAEILHKAFTSKGGAKIEALYKGEIGSFNGDDSAADLSLCSTLAFWTAKNASQMERIWLASPLGARRKTQLRPDYRKRTIEKAISGTTDVYEKKKIVDTKELDLLFKMNDKKEKVFIQNTENICRVLRKHAKFSGRLRFDNFKNSFEILLEEKKIWKNMSDTDAINFQTQISILFPFFSMVNKTMVSDAMIKVAKENEIDSAADFIRSVIWDKKARLDSWLTHTYGVENNAYHTAVGSNWLKGLVKRIIEPGCKFDYVLVLEGKQGSKKSTSLNILGGSWHVETTMSTDNKDFFMQFQGKAIVEFSEGETLSRTEVKRMKAIITMQTDKYRAPYERTSEDYPRHCVFAMTTNQEEYLKDETGNRRYMPVAVVSPQANVEWLKENRDQLFAEAYHRTFILKENVYDFPEEDMLREQDARRVNDPNADLVLNWYYNDLTDMQREEGITITQAFKVIHGNFSAKHLDKYNEMLIVDILKRNLKLENKQVMRGGLRLRKWFKVGTIPREETQLDITTKEIYDKW